jgi:hypothetical protein
MFWIILIGIIILTGLFNPWTGLFGNTFYSPKQKPEPAKPELKHKSFQLTKED